MKSNYSSLNLAAILIDAFEAYCDVHSCWCFIRILKFPDGTYSVTHTKME